jgi:hypothetical protein
MKIIALVLLCMCFADIANCGGVYLKNVMKAEQNADVNITSMRWGRDGDSDVIIGQIASKKFRSVTLILDSIISTQTIRRLTIRSAVHACGDQSRNGRFGGQSGWGGDGTPNGRVNYCAECMRANAKSAMTTRGCIFKITFPHDSIIRKMRVVDVLADVLADEESVTYFCKFNISPDLNASGSKVVIPLRAIIHEPDFFFTDIPKNDQKEMPAEVVQKAMPPESNRIKTTADAPAISMVCSNCSASRKCSDCRGRGFTSSECSDCDATGKVLSKANAGNQLNKALSQTTEILSKMLQDKTVISVRQPLPNE